MRNRSPGAHAHGAEGGCTRWMGGDEPESVALWRVVTAMVATSECRGDGVEANCKLCIPFRLPSIRCDTSHSHAHNYGSWSWSTQRNCCWRSTLLLTKPHTSKATPNTYSRACSMALALERERFFHNRQSAGVRADERFFWLQHDR